MLLTWLQKCTSLVILEGELSCTPNLFELVTSMKGDGMGWKDEKRGEKRDDEDAAKRELSFPSSSCINKLRTFSVLNYV